jgi:hypothetical protein
MARASEDATMILRNRDVEGSPFPSAKGETEIPGLDVKVDALRGDPNEGGADVREPAFQSAAKPTTMSGGEGESNLGSRKPDPSRDVRFESPISSVSGDSLMRGDS